jgi:hypothetical protein
MTIIMKLTRTCHTEGNKLMGTQRVMEFPVVYGT